VTLAYIKDVTERAARSFGATLGATAPLASIAPWWVPFACSGGAAGISVALSLLAYFRGDKGTASFVKLGGEK
jgi:hypothetical protein